MKFYQKLLSGLLGAMFILTTAPILYFSLFDYATGDDLGYGAGARQALLRGEGLYGVIQAACTNVVDYWHSWQGTWASIFLFSIEPSIWGERLYIMTAWLAVGALTVGIVYFASKLLSLLGYQKLTIASLSFAVLTLGLQYIPTPRGGIYWYTSVAHYIIPFGVCMLVMGATLEFLQKRRIRCYVFVLLAMTYLGGAGYPALVMAGVWVFLVMIKGLRDNNKRSVVLIFPLILELTGFVISACAPGNKVRGGENFGFSVENVMKTIGGAVITALHGMGTEFKNSPLLLPLFLIIMIAVTLEEHPSCDGKDKQIAFLSVLGSIAFSSLVRMPEIYAAVEVSGGVPDTYHFVDLLGLGISVVTVTRWCCFVVERHFSGLQKYGKKIRTALFIIAAVIAALQIKPIIKKSLDYELYQFASSGSLADYDSQMKERLSILNQDEKDVIVPDMNSDQGPFMHMPLGRNSEEWTNSITAEFYGKDSVIAVPREEFEAMKQQ